MKNYNKNPLAIVIASLCATVSIAQADDQIIAGPDATSVVQFNPQLHDQQKNTIVVGLTDTGTPGYSYNAGTVVNIKAVNNDIQQSFLHGESGNVYPKKTLQELYDAGKLIDPDGLVGKDRLNLGNMVHAITVPDPITGGVRTIQTYDELLFNDPGTLSISDADINDVKDVNGDQYINMRIGEIDSTGGTLNIDMGDKTKNHTDSSNNLVLAAKQTTLFEVDGTGDTASIINWDTNNRVYFNAASASSTDPRPYHASNFVNYLGTFSVATLDGATHDFNVIDRASLQTYNEFLKTELGTGNLESTRYRELFDLAAKIFSGDVYYETEAQTPSDEIFQGQGDRLVIHATGSNAQANINSILDIEVAASNSNQSGVLIENGAKIYISENGLLGSRNNQALSIKNGASGINDGVINGNFTTKGVTHTDSGKLANGSVQLDDKSFGLATAVNVENSTFDNKGVLNLNSASGSVSGTAIGIDLSKGSQAVNTGSINVGIANSSQSSTTIGVRVAGQDDQFTNLAEIYIGRGPQANVDDDSASTDITLNQRYTTSGIRVDNNGSATNEGDITIGKKVQNAAAMQSIKGDNVVMVNKGNIVINGKASNTPNMNFGMLVMDSGINGGIKNEGNITLSGINAVGVQILSTAGNSAYAATTDNSKIIIEGQANTTNGTRNYGVWVEGQGTGVSSADIDGDIILRGDGAIGVHARGNASVKVNANSVPQLESGTKQVAFFAYGNNAQFEVGGAHNFDVSTDQSTFFRLENGADLTEYGLALAATGKESVGIIGTGNGSGIRLSSAKFSLVGEKSTAIIIEGGARGNFDPNTKISQAGNSTVGVVVDGKRHNLAGKETTDGAGNVTYVNSSIQITSAGAPTGLIGYDVKNGGTLLHKGSIDYTGGTGHTGISLTGTDAKKPSTAANEGTIHVNHGTGILVDGIGTNLAKAGVVTVDDGVAGIQLKNGAGATLQGGSSTITTNGTAHGILMDTGASHLNAVDTTLNILGSGNGIENSVETSNITLVNSAINVVDGSGIRTATSINPNSTATINVTGAGSGFGFKTIDGTVTTGNLILGEGYNIAVTGAQGIGIEALTTGQVKTAANVDVSHAEGGAALLAGTASSTINIGNLISASTSAPVVDLTNGSGTSFENAGGTISASSATVTAVLGSSGNDKLIFGSGTVRGEINSGAGEDFVLFNGGTLDGGISMEGTNSTTHIQGVDLSTTYHTQAKSGNNTLTLDNIRARGGSFASDDLAKGTNLNSGWSTINLTNSTLFTLTDNLTLTGSTVNIDGTSVLFGGNQVNPIISSDNPETMRVQNSGTIDLTNGGMANDTLTIGGNYYSTNGKLNMNTLLNTGGALSNQITDRFLVEQDATGSSAVQLVISGGGAMTDLNRDGVISSNEGISIVQVAGSSTADAFALTEPVLSGAYVYDLYSFAPGISDASQRVVAGRGNSFWDYRLANAFVCPVGEYCGPVITPPVDPTDPPVDPTDPPVTPPVTDTGNARPQLTPQMPAYISLPLGIASYNTVILDDLHKRLGEVRHDNALNNQGTGELFIRYISAQSKYKSNVSFKNYGYDFDLDVHAFQLGANLFKFNGNNNDIFRGGLAWTHGTSSFKPKSVDGYSKTKLTSDTLALYLTWQKENGFYVDGVIAYNRHKANVETRSFLKRDQDLKARGWLASVETGYPFKFDNGLVVEPQAQLTYQSVKVKDFRDLNGANLRYDDFSQTTLRLGMRGYKTWVTENGNQYTPYVRANYYHNFGKGSKLKVTPDSYRYDGQIDTFTGGKGGRAIQVGLGMTATFKNNLSLFGEVDYQKNLGSYGSKGVRVSVGAKWVF